MHNAWTCLRNDMTRSKIAFTLSEYSDLTKHLHILISLHCSKKRKLHVK